MQILKPFQPFIRRNVQQASLLNRYLIVISNRGFHESAATKRASPTHDSVPMRILLLGSPGAGKGTQSARIQKNFNVGATISSGDILRQNIARGTKVGKIAAEQMARGAFVSDDIMIELIKNELSAFEQQNWLLDGFPRTIKQAMALDENLILTGQPLNLVINLHVPEDVILKRIMGEKLMKRPDDNPETFKIRLQKHHTLIEPLLKYYAKHGILVTCAGRT
ncbi:6737_t:CDS:2, partial [Ambispora leptoticha]